MWEQGVSGNPEMAKGVSGGVGVVQQGLSYQRGEQQKFVGLSFGLSHAQEGQRGKASTGGPDAPPSILGSLAPARSRPHSLLPVSRLPGVTLPWTWPSRV